MTCDKRAPRIQRSLRTGLFPKQAVQKIFLVQREPLLLIWLPLNEEEAVPGLKEKGLPGGL